MSDKEVIIVSEEDAYNQLHRGLAVSNHITTQRDKLDTIEGQKGGGFPLARGIALYCLNEHRGDANKAVEGFGRMIKASENAYLSGKYDKTPEYWDDKTRTWKTRELLGTAWATGKSAVLSALVNEVNFNKDESGKLLGKTAIEEAVKAKKRALKRATDTPDELRNGKIASILELITSVKGGSKDEKERDAWEEAEGLVHAVKSGGIYDV